MSDEKPLKPSRRAVLTGAIGGVLGVAAGAVGAGVMTGQAEREASPESPTVDATGETQAGIHRPASPQQFGRILVLDLEGAGLGWLAAAGERILELVDGAAADLLPDGAGDLTVSVGLGPRLIAAIDPTLPGAEPLPLFVGDERLAANALGGDVLLAAYSSDPTVLGGVLAELAAMLPGSSTRWEQLVFRGQGEGTKARNPLGFMDGIVVPRGEAELRENVWIDSGPLAGGTICVLRRLRLDSAGFRAMSVDAREAVIGRRLVDGAPLSGGGPDDEVDLRAKTPEGELVVPARSHARAAHPSFTGSPLMLRRSYSYDDGEDDSGLVFISFQKELRAFVATQHRLDENDDLMGFATPTASATFLMLPGFTRDTPLGSSLV